MTDVLISTSAPERRIGTDVAFAVGIVAMVTILVLPVPTVF